MGAFINELSAETQNRQKLLPKVTVWQWKEGHEKKIQNFKEMFIKETSLQYFHVRLVIKMLTDVS